MKLKTLQIDAFRGATKPLTIEFDPDKRITMIFGENGNGKSTITDSLVCLCTDKKGSLDDKSSIDEFFASITRKPEDVKIALVTDAGSFQATLASKSFLKNPLDGQPLVRHLRRSQITQFIEAQPNKRYDQLDAFIDVENIVKAEEALRKLERETEDEQKVEIRTLAKATSTLEDAWRSEGSPLSSWEDWAHQETIKDIAQEDKKYKTLQDVSTKWSSIVDTNNRLIKDKTALQESIAARTEAERKMQEAQEGNEAASEELLNLLQSAKNFITAKDKINSCPVCDNSIEKEGVVSSLSSKIDSMNAFKALVLVVKAARQSVVAKQNTLSETSKTILKKIAELEKAIETLSDEPFPAITIKLSSIKKRDETEKMLEEFDSLFTDLNEELNKQIEVATNIKKAIDQHNLIKGQYSSILDVRKKAQKTQSLLEATRKTLAVVEKARKDFIQSELDSISSEVEALYQRLHPDENLGGISLKLKKNVKKSLELNADFHGKKGITPQSAYSESHLDTLGICVFIALAKKYGSTNSILILDDVVMSVDERHLDRFIELLHEEEDKFAHIIITTHYRPWRDRYRYHRAPPDKVHFIELKPWSLENGIRIQNGKNAIDELRIALDDSTPFDRQQIVSKAGIILENACDFLSIQFKSRVPRKPRNDYQLRELLDSFSSKLLSVLKVEHLGKNMTTGKYDGLLITKSIALKELLDKIKNLAIVRNWVGAHYNPDGSTVSDTDVEQFGKLTLEFSELLICPDTGSFPNKNKSGSYWETKNGSIRLYPLQEP